MLIFARERLWLLEKQVLSFVAIATEGENADVQCS
jgi:hypothetical protein